MDYRFEVGDRVGFAPPMPGSKAGIGVITEKTVNRLSSYDKSDQPAYTLVFDGGCVLQKAFECSLVPEVEFRNRMAQAVCMELLLR